MYVRSLQRMRYVMCTSQRPPSLRSYIQERLLWRATDQHRQNAVGDDSGTTSAPHSTQNMVLMPICITSGHAGLYCDKVRYPALSPMTASRTPLPSSISGFQLSSEWHAKPHLIPLNSFGELALRSQHQTNSDVVFSRLGYGLK